MANKESKTMRVGLLVASSLVILMIFVFFIGSEQKIFARKNEYDVQLENVSGLAQGNPVRMSGVTIGVIKDITLPRDPKERNVQIELMIDRKYAERVRGDSRARLKKMGLIAGDSYIEVTPGTMKFAAVEPGSTIPAQRQTNVDQLISSGEDLVDNFVQISYSLKNVLGRVDRGEGLIGELTSTPETKQRLTDTVLTTLNKTNAMLTHIESGKGVMGKLVYDDRYGDQLTGSLASAATNLQTITGSLQTSFASNTGTIPALMNDPAAKDRLFELVENLRTTSSNLATFTGTLQTGQGLVPRLLNDKQYGDEALVEFRGLIGQLNEVVQKINTGEGTAGRLITDPTLYESVNDVLIGINESKLLRWLIRSRQQSGIEKRYEERKKVNKLPGVDATEPPAVPLPDPIPQGLAAPAPASEAPVAPAAGPVTETVAPEAPAPTDTTGTAVPTSTAP
jgi:phospholipid/cholesterol/gamma-HCH transport system substrate-binding protein